MPVAVPHSVKRVLYYSPRKALAREFSQAMGEVAECRSRRGRAGPLVCCGPLAFEFVVRHEVGSALRTLHHEFFNLVLLDLREPVQRRRRRRGDDFASGLALLDAMDREPDIERRYGFHKIVALVSGDVAPEVDARIAALGARGVGRVMRDMAVCHLNPDCGHLPPRHAFARHVLGEMAQLTQHRTVGKTALCLSGGGITGLFFELGALKCVEDCCEPEALNQLDLYFGISAGGALAAMLANGYGVSEFMAGIAGCRAGGRIPPIDLNVLDASHLDRYGLSAPLRGLIAILGRGLHGVLRGRLPFSFGSLVFEYGDLVHAPFNTAGFESLLRRAFRAPGCSNDFRRLRRRLYIGATDQDRKEHVLFGDRPHDRVPISRAIQASMSLNPVFAPTRVAGRYYADGAVTRTSNFVEAIHRGADLILALDPLVPWVPGRAGVSRQRGIFYNADQDIRTVSYTRFETTRNWVLRRHPEVSLYTFLPANNVRRLLSVNPMDHRRFLRIWKGAYLGTLKRIHALGYRMRGDLSMHGMPFDSSRADAVAARLRAVGEPRFEDFFPDGRVELRRRERPKAARGLPRSRSSSAA